MIKGVDAGHVTTDPVLWSLVLTRWTLVILFPSCCCDRILWRKDEILAQSSGSGLPEKSGQKGFEEAGHFTTNHMTSTVKRKKEMNEGMLVVSSVSPFTSPGSQPRDDATGRTFHPNQCNQIIPTGVSRGLSFTELSFPSGWQLYHTHFAGFG